MWGVEEGAAYEQYMYIKKETFTLETNSNNHNNLNRT